MFAQKTFDTFYQQHTGFLRLVFFSIVLYVAFLFALWWYAVQIPPEIPFFYSLPRGAEQLATMSDVWLLSWVLGALLLFNVIISWLLLKNSKMLAFVLLWGSVLLVLLFSYSLVRIILLVT